MFKGFLRQGTAATVKVGPYVDATDGHTPETSLTIAKADVRLSKNGGNLAAANADQGAEDAGAAHDELGLYDISFDETDTNTCGTLLMAGVAESGARTLQHPHTWVVLSAPIYDALIAGTAPLSAADTIGQGVNKSANHVLAVIYTELLKRFR